MTTPADLTHSQLCAAISYMLGRRYITARQHDEALRYAADDTLPYANSLRDRKPVQR